MKGDEDALVVGLMKDGDIIADRDLGIVGDEWVESQHNSFIAAHNESYCPCLFMELAPFICSCFREVANIL